MRLGVLHPVRPRAVRHAVPVRHLIGPVKLERLRALVHELTEMLKPGAGPLGVLVGFRIARISAGDERARRLLGGVFLVLLRPLDVLVMPRFRIAAGDGLAILPGGFPGDQLLLVPEQVVVAAQPEAQLHAHAAHCAGEGVRSLRAPVREVETPRVPALARGGVVELLHPPRLQADHVARDFVVAEPHRLVDELELVDPLVRDEREAEVPHGRQRGASGEARVRVEHRAVACAGEEVEVGLALLRRADDRVGIRLAHVDRVPPRRVHEESPSLARERHGHRDVAVDVLDVDLVRAGTALDVVARDVAQAVDARLLLERETDFETRPHVLHLGLHLQSVKRRGSLLRGKVGEYAVAVHAGFRPLCGAVPFQAHAPEIVAELFDFQLRRAEAPRQADGQRHRDHLDLHFYDLLFICFCVLGARFENYTMSAPCCVRSFYVILAPCESVI